jgi:hypothetical protein
MIDKTMCEVLWRNISDFYVNLRVEVAAVTRNREIFRHKTSHMVLFIIFLEGKHKIVLHLSIFYEYQQFFQHRICFSIQPPDYSDPWPRLAHSTSFFLIMLFNNTNIVSIKLYLLRIRWERSVNELREKTGWLGIRVMYPSGATCLSVNCCFSELAL